jgi:hypothetical protein
MKKWFLWIFSYNFNWPNENAPACKIRIYVLNVCFGVSSWALVSANVDRYLSSSVSIHYRQLSTARTARRLLTIIFVVCTLIYLEIFYCYQASVPNVPVACYPQISACQLYNDWMLILFTSIMPSVFMAIFGLLTIRNIRTCVIQPIRKPVTTVNTIVKQARSRKNDRNISQMLLVQVSLNIFLVEKNRFRLFKTDICKPFSSSNFL